MRCSIEGVWLHEKTNCPGRYFNLSILYDTVKTAQDVELRTVSDDHKTRVSQGFGRKPTSFKMKVEAILVLLLL
jgi:hypothetical protein